MYADPDVSRVLDDLYALISIRAAGGGGGGADVPLVRTKWIDGDTVTAPASANGAAQLPYKSVTAFFTAIGVGTSVADTTQAYVGLVSPATVAAYTENPAFPPYRNTEVRSENSTEAAVVTGNMTWANTAAAGGVFAPAVATDGLRNIILTGGFTYSDDAGAPVSALLFTADGAGTLNSLTATTIPGGKLAEIFLENMVVTNNLTSVAGATGATVLAYFTTFTGNITAKVGDFNSCIFGGGGGQTFTFAAGSTPQFLNCTFSGGSIAAGAGSTITMDATSWASFRQNGMTLSSGVVALLSGNPLTRVRYVDGGGLATSAPTGSIEYPYVTIPTALAGIGVPTSASDANQTMLVRIAPSTIAAYTANPAFPSYRNLKVWSDGVGGQIGTIITGNATWANTAASGGTAGSSAQLALHDIFISGTLTVTDDATVAGNLLITGSEGNFSSGGATTAGLGGALIATGATDLTRITCVGVVMAAITSTASASGANINLEDSQVGSVTGAALLARRTSFIAATITVNTGSTMSFQQCTFTASATLVAGAAGVITMDGPSWASFLEAGGTVTSGIVLIVGGSQAGLVRSPPTAASGGSTSLGDASVSISLNGTGATAGFTGGGNLYEAKSTLTASRTITIKTGGGEQNGDTIDIVRSSVTGAFTLVVNNNAGTGIGTIAASSRGFLRAQFNTTIANDWGMVAGGSFSEGTTVP